MRIKGWRISSWLILISMLLTIFSAQPTLASLLVHAANVLVLILAVVIAHHEH
jgi:hypothetical protein